MQAHLNAGDTMTDCNYHMINDNWTEMNEAITKASDNLIDIPEKMDATTEKL